MNAKHDAGLSLAHRLYCELGLCNGDPACFHRLTPDQQTVWEDAVKTVCAPGWQPIDTAPKNMIDKLLFGPCQKGDSVFAPDANVGWWSDGEWVTRTPNETIHPTHWMPLPAAPQ